MSESTLSFANSSSFRNVLLSRNLEPYEVTGVYTPPSGPVAYETIQSSFSVIDSPDNLMTDGGFSNQLYPLNEYGPEGGFNLDITYNGPALPVNSNQGEYNPTETVLDLVNEFYIDAAYIENRFGPDGGFNNMVVITDIQNNNKLYQPYWDPPMFVPSSYSPFSILLSSNPVGNNGLLSQDSFLARIGAEQLNTLFKARVDAEVFQNTVGLVNLESLSDPFRASLIVAGREPLVYQNWQITVPENPIVAVADFITRLGGAYWPVSPIPGDYFNENEVNAQTPQVSNALNVVNQLTGGFLGPILNLKRSPSEIFLANTGNAQRSALFRNIEYNKYQPGFNRDFGGLLGIGQAIINPIISLINPNGTLTGGYYVGSRNAEPSNITSPANQIPVNPFGQQVETPVYGPSELAKLYEGNQDSLNFGLPAKSLSDGGGIDGQFVWTSPKYKGNAGFKATPGGGSGSLDSEFNQISSGYLRNESTNIDFKTESILDQTQRLINSADNVTGASRLKHVGNAINQVSKVFNDGYKEMTKGSQVVSYVDFATGTEEGIEYCRVFTKDTPYYTYADLQKTDGITNAGRRFSSSILDNTYNLNIAPLKNPGSTNIVPNNDQGLGGYAKKYMFSIENLAWRTSSRPGFTYDELPVCEKGPNGGRVMWFPPYELKFNDTSSANWNQQTFLGRPEPIYTYKDTSRTGTLSWKIIVDHPSILNVIVNKHLKTNKEKMNSIIDSFFAGCTKYDIYQLALKYNTIPSKDLYTYQQILNNPQLTPEELRTVKDEIPVDNTSQPTGNSNNPGTDSQVISTNNDTSAKEAFETKFNELAFYFHNDEPDPGTNNTVSTQSYNQTYLEYKNVHFPIYQSNANSIFSQNNNYCKSNVAYCENNKIVTQFFDNTVVDNFNTIDDKDTGLVVSLFNLLKEKNATVTLNLIGSASAPASKKYNVNLSTRRIDSVIKYLKERSKQLNCDLQPYIDSKRLIIPTKSEGEGEKIIFPKTSEGTGRVVNCTDDIIDGTTGKVTKNSQTYSVDAMACRRVRLSSIVNITPVDSAVTDSGGQVSEITPTVQKELTPEIQPQKPKPEVRIEQKLKEGIGKKILRQLLSECDYFEVIEKEVPMLYDSIKEKIKYFNPAFHSMTPEGLNARLTFLNQCVRPGETIPIIDADGNPRYNDARNTSFGTPPILVLRIGDFYHTKIVPKSVAFTYEPLIFDMNPEGIGVQPMIANVTMSFDFIGGHGLDKPVEQLQNALSFNYYGNTEVYDERSVFTDTSFKKIDNDLIKNIIENEPQTNDLAATDTQENAFGDTIGTIINFNRVDGGETGEISYQAIMDKMLRTSPEYFTTIVNQLESVVLKYNYGILQLLDEKRDYVDGIIDNNNTVQIYGKPLIDNQVESIFTKVKDAIDNNTNPIIKKLNGVYSSITSNEMDNIKNNIKKYLTLLSNSFTNEIQTIITELCEYQQNTVLDLIKLVIINGVDSNLNGFDGKKTDKGVPLVYQTSGTDKVSDTTLTVVDNTLIELKQDTENIYNFFTKTNELLIDYKILKIPNEENEIGGFIPVGKLTDNLENKRFFMIISRVFDDKDKLTEFINYILTNNFTSSNKLKNKFEKVVNDIAKEYSQELREEEKIFEKLRKDKKFKDFTIGVENVLYPVGKTRVLNYTTVITNTELKDTYKNILENLFSGGNTAKSEFFIEDVKSAKFNRKFN